jgi:hypothetical protein
MEARCGKSKKSDFGLVTSRSERRGDDNQIIRRLPGTDGEFEYVIRSAYENHERVARESELSHF